MKVKLPCGVSVRSFGRIKGQRTIYLEYDSGETGYWVGSTKDKKGRYSNIHHKILQITDIDNLLPFADFLQKLHKEVGTVKED